MEFYLISLKLTYDMQVAAVGLVVHIAFDDTDDVEAPDRFHDIVSWRDGDVHLHYIVH